MNTEKLLKTIPIIQNQMDALLDFNVSLARYWMAYSVLVLSPEVFLLFMQPILLSIRSYFGKIYFLAANLSMRKIKLSYVQVNANELTNGVINAAFMLLFKDSIRLFAAYNEGIINLLGKACHTSIHARKNEFRFSCFYRTFTRNFNCSLWCTTNTFCFFNNNYYFSTFIMNGIQHCCSIICQYCAI